MRPARRANNLATFMCRLSCNLGASASYNPQGLSRPVQGLLYLTRDKKRSFSQHQHVTKTVSPALTKIKH